MLGDQPPLVRSPLPGPAGQVLLDQLAQVESPAFTARRARRQERSGAAQDPIVWTEARGANVIDADGNRYVDLTSGFGVASVGHAHPRVVGAICAQAARLLHALGDLHPSTLKIELLSRLCALAPIADARAVLSLSGSDAVETALKTATLATGKPGVLAFEGAYHGLSHGPLAACGYAESFRAPFAAQLNPHVVFAPWPAHDASLRAALADVAGRLDADVGAILVEPIQGRGGVRMPPAGFLAGLADLAHEHGGLLIVDEIFTGFGRCGAMFLSAEAGVEPDLLCLGKSLGGGLPVSACVGRAEVMAAWGDPVGEAIHTGTFFGHPLGCAAALATLDVIEDEALAARTLELGEGWSRGLAALDGVRVVRGRGLMLGLELEADVLVVVRKLLERGYLTLPAGAGADVLQLVPPLNISRALLDGFVETLGEVLT
ncbi:MAG: aspartate aminotransferase family protein [Deltaproteobacteria bacterium]|nr:aspartate aminotransferase family protein [Deltaproteobacteria bacterium]